MFECYKETKASIVKRNRMDSTSNSNSDEKKTGFSIAKYALSGRDEKKSYTLLGRDVCCCQPRYVCLGYASAHYARLAIAHFPA
ncbi:unnamed protein product [Trichogramma brassicae]|uniref:Uncharacterized protein n=1 Tax=Trichogramma brassicae TaxID=86971 RepID=A0A6H5IZF3_9HYME|nr:unnamed protein product [Trichogramma brassicae]